MFTEFTTWMRLKGDQMLARGKARMQAAGERGEIDIGGILVMGIGMVFLAVGFIIYPIVMDACDSLLAYECTANASILASTFTGFEAIVGITPLLVLVGYLAAGLFAMYLGVKIMKGQSGSTSVDLGTMLMLAISLIFIAIGLIIMPVALDGICTVLTGDGSGISSSYSGLESILLITPLLLLISFVSGAVITGYFGLKKLAA